VNITTREYDENNLAQVLGFLGFFAFFVIGMCAATLRADRSLYILAFPVNFALLITTFVVSLSYFERRAQD
jgi:hypothetical protein